MVHYNIHEQLKDSQTSASTGRRQAYSIQDQGHEWCPSLTSSHEKCAQEYEATFLAADETPEQMPEVYEGNAEPWWPELNDALETNQAAYQAYGQGPWGGVIGGKQGMIESALNASKQHYYYGPEEDEAERLAVAAAKMAHRLHANQAFVDGNKRTAYVTARRFLDLNGLGHLSPISDDGSEDEELADHLIGQDFKGHPTHGHLYKSEDDFINMMRDRYYMGGPRPGYVPMEWPPRGEEGEQQSGTFLNAPR